MKISLKNLILIVVFLSTGCTLLSSLYAGYQLERETLIENTLETNRVYAEKLANTTDDYLKSTLQTLKVSSEILAPFMKGNEKALLNEANRLRKQSDMFNSVTITNSTGKVLAVSPENLNLEGKILSSHGANQALKEKKPLISKPYISITGRLIIIISHPIFNEDGQYLGLVGGTIYLKERSILNQLLGEHFYHDGSYVYVVDSDGRIIYHQFSDRINDNAKANPVVQKVMKGQSGTEQVVNTQGIDMLAGYTPIPTAQWGVVSQRPTAMAVAPSDAMMKRMLLTSLPFIFLSFIVILIILTMITRPLQKLAHLAENSSENDQEKDIEKIPAWYYEAIQLKKALMNSFRILHEKVNDFQQQSSIDSLTGLYNRRAMDEQLIKLKESHSLFSIILLDIDRFKKVNDTYGHSIGDEVLIFLAKLMRETVRGEDICCRYGGEEFLIILPETDLLLAEHIAEKLRSRLEQTISPTGQPITISAGIAGFPNDAITLNKLINLADQCLYQAKQTGRNKVLPLSCLN